MKLKSFLLGLAVGTASSHQTRDAPFGRGCLVPTAETPGIQAQSAGIDTNLNTSKPLPKKIDVDVHFHVASTVNDTHLITQSILDRQWKVLRDSYLPYNIELTLKSTDRIVSDRAGQYFLVDESTGEFPNYVNYEKEKNEYLSSSRRGGYDALNIYFFSRYLPGATGYCTFPTVRVAGEKEILGLDGCAVSGLTMPGITVEKGGFPEYNLGHIAVHEAGHWFGLNHTFVGGCTSSTGDFVDDTPRQRSEIYGCPTGSDSCPDSPGLDPIQNHMGYTDDDCTSQFTPGQVKRMFTTFFGFRRKM